MEKWIKTRGSGIVRKRDKKEDKEDNRENEKRVYKKGNRREKGWVRDNKKGNSREREWKNKERHGWISGKGMKGTTEKEKHKRI